MQHDEQSKTEHTLNKIVKKEARQKTQANALRKISQQPTKKEKGEKKKKKEVPIETEEKVFNYKGKKSKETPQKQRLDAKQVKE